MVMVLAPKKNVVPVKGPKKEAQAKPAGDKAPKAPKEAKKSESKPATAGS